MTVRCEFAAYDTGSSELLVFEDPCKPEVFRIEVFRIEVFRYVALTGDVSFRRSDQASSPCSS